MTRAASNTAIVADPGPAPDALAAAFQHAMIGIAIGGPDGRLRDANPALLRLLGHERDELLKLHISDITHADDHGGDAVQWARLASGEIDAYQREKRYLRGDGSILWGMVTVSALRDEAGVFLGSSAQIQDITAQKAAEAALRENESQLEALVDQLPVVLYSQPWGGTHAVRYVSPRFEHLTGLGRDDIPTNHHDHLARVHPDDRPRVQTIDAWADRTGETARAEYRLMGGNGEWIWIDHQSVLMRDEQGQPVAWHGSLLDVSERRRLEASLQESDARFRRAFEDSAIGMAIGTPDDICVDANDAYCRIVGVRREELIGRSFKNVTYPEDIADQDLRLAQLVAGEADAFVVEKRYLRPDGEVVTGLATISAVRDDTGALLYCVGQILDITAQKATAAALSESEELLRSIVEQTPAAVYRLEPGTPGPFTFASPHFKTLTGLSIDDQVTKVGDFFARVHPEDLQMLRDADANAARTGVSFEAEYRVRGENGSWVWLHDRSIPARDEQGQVVAWHGILLDISEQKRLQAELSEKDARLQSLIEQLPVALYSIEPEPGGRYSYTSPQFEFLTGLSPEEVARGSIALEARIHPDDLAAAKKASEASDATGTMLETEYRVLNANSEWRWVHDRATLAGDEAGKPFAWHGVLLDISERKQLQAALLENEERLRVLVEQLPAALFSLEPGSDSHYAYVSPRFAELTGMTPEDVARGTEALFERMHPDDVARVRKADRRSRETEQPHEVEYRVRRAEGGWVWLQERAMLARDTEGRPLAWHGVLLDISEQRKAEAALSESAQHGQALIASALDAVIEMDRGGQIIEFNPAAERIFGYRREQVVGRSLADLIIPPELRGAHRVGLARYLATGEGPILGKRLEMAARRADGSAFAAELAVTPLTGGADPKFVGFVRDISDRIAIETALRESESRFRSTFEGAGIGMALCDPVCRVLIANPALERLLGFGSGELNGHDSDLLTHPDDLERHAGYRRRLQAGEIDSYELEKRYARKDGVYVWVTLNVTAIRDDRGVLQSVIGQLQDITARKEAEEALRESEARFRSTFEGAAIGMALASPDGRFLLANPALERLLGYGPGELAGIHSDDITFPEDRGDQAVLRKRLRAGEIDGYQFEKRFARMDGEIVWVALNATAIHDDRGDVQSVIGQVLDITARKEAEEALRQSEARFRSTFEGAGIGMSLADVHGRFFDANPAFCQFLGYTREELLELTYLDITHPDDREHSLSYTRRLFQDGFLDFSVEKRYVRADGRTVWGHLTITTVRDPGGQPYYEIAQVQDITARKEAEAARRESEARFQSIFEDAGIGMAITTPAGQIELVNPAMARFLGHVPEELAGLQIQDLTFPDDAEAQDVYRQRTRAGEIDAYLMEKRYLTRNGDIVWGLLNVSAIRDETGDVQALIGQVQDITARKEAESALRDSEARFRALVQNDPDVIVIIDESMNITYVSPSSQAAFGATPEEVGVSLKANQNRVHPEDLERTLALLRDVRDRPGAMASTESRIRHADKGWRWFQVSIANLLEDPGVRGYLVNLRDVTERKRAEIATATALKTQQVAIAELERLNRSKSRFLSTISHEFRTPLTAIIGYSEFMARNASEPTLIAEDAEVIHREASRLNRMVDDILLLDRADARHISLSVARVDLNAVVQDVAETFRPLMDLHHVALNLDPALHAIEGDGDRLAQALTNLISNAMKYAPVGGPITIATRNEDEGVLISVRDEGIGIAADDFSRIFDRFERIETGIAGRISGTGLGLSIVKEIVNLHGGRVWVESRLGDGSTFFLAIPARPPMRTAPPD